MGVEVPPLGLFSLSPPTVARLAQAIEAEEWSAEASTRLSPLTTAPRESALPPASGQEQVYFIHQVAPDSLAYNSQVTVDPQGPLEVPTLEEALTEIIRRHEIYRTLFAKVDGGLQQQIQAPWKAMVPVVDLEEVPEEERREQAGPSSPGPRWDPPIAVVSRPMAVPFIDLRRFEPDFLDRWAAICRRISENTQFVGGPEVARLEERLSAELAVPHTVACANGTDALQLALRAVGVGEGDSVLIPDATFWATFEAVVNVGARVVTVDIDPSDLQMDFELFRRAVGRHRPKAAILVHLYGWGSARLDDFRAFCAAEGIALVEDGAQAVGVTWRGESIYKNAHLATISFYPAKVLGACGDAGAVVTQDTDLATRLRQLGNHGRTGHYEHGLLGWNSRMGGFDAAYLNLSLDYLEDRLESRRRAAVRYRERLVELDVFTVGPPEGCQENGYLNVTLHDPEERPRVEARLKDKGIGFGNVYPGAMSMQPGAEGFLLDAVGGERADLLARSVLNLPLFAYITDEEIDEVLSVLGGE